ncbi:MAG: hypothetical protein ACRDHV_07780 [Actinomycetota bacterium]
MATGFCTRCGAVLRNGACPHGHPQRALRARRRGRRKWPVVVLSLAVLLGAGGYLALVWYPLRAAGELMGPSSAEYTEALRTYRAAVDSLPVEDADAETVAEATEGILTQAESARGSLSTAQLALEDRSAPQIPVISGRPPLEGALDVRGKMLTFYTGALETVATLDGVARYLGGLSGTLPEIDEVEDSLRGAGNDLGGPVATARSVAGRIIADLEAITPPAELGALHSSLTIIARRIEEDLEQIEDARGQATAPVIEVLLDDVAEQATSFRDAVAQAPQAAIQSGLGSALKQLDRRVGRINSGLTELRGRGVTGLTIPG